MRKLDCKSSMDNETLERSSCIFDEEDGLGGYVCLVYGPIRPKSLYILPGLFYEILGDYYSLFNKIMLEKLA